MTLFWFFWVLLVAAGLLARARLVPHPGTLRLVPLPAPAPCRPVRRAAAASLFGARPPGVSSRDGPGSGRDPGSRRFRLRGLFDRGCC